MVSLLTFAISSDQLFFYIMAHNKDRNICLNYKHLKVIFREYNTMDAKNNNDISSQEFIYLFFNMSKYFIKIL